MTEDRVSQRGFTYYGPGPIELSTGYRTRIEVYESSAALSRSRTAPSGEDSGPFLWMKVVQEQPVDDNHDDNHDDMRTVAVSAHLNRAEVAEFCARIGRWLDTHPAEDERAIRPMQLLTSLAEVDQLPTNSIISWRNSRYPDEETVALIARWDGPSSPVTLEHTDSGAYWRSEPEEMIEWPVTVIRIGRVEGGEGS